MLKGLELAGALAGVITYKGVNHIAPRPLFSRCGLEMWNMKTCTKCNIEKPLLDFYSGVQGVWSRCKHCVTAIKKAVRLKYPENYRMQAKRHSITAREKFPIRHLFHSMCARCKNPNNTIYKNYGGRGISICKEWTLDPKLFIAWAKRNGWKRGLQIDRIDNDGNYEPSNCRFVTQGENVRNKRNTILNNFDVIEIRWLASVGIDRRIISETFGISYSHVGNIISNTRWIHEETE